MRINFVAMGCVPPEQAAVNIRHSRTLGLQAPEEKQRPPLAVVGGGRSLVEHTKTLQEWPGDIWANGSAFGWCRSNGIEAIFLCIDPHTDSTPLAIGAREAIVSSCCDRSLFDLLLAQGTNTTVFDLVHDSEKQVANHGCTGVTATPELSLRMGYRDVTYFGCEGSFEFGTSHAYRNEPTEFTVQVQVGEESFITHPAFLMQSEYLATMMRLCPAVFKERSGGLLRAMIADVNYDITHINQALADHLAKAA